MWARIGLGAVVVAGLIGLPYLVGYEQQILSSVVVIYAIVAVSLVILTGWAGQISLGQWGFAGVGAAVASGVAVHLRHTAFVHGDFFVALLLAGLVGAAVSVVIGLPALRIQGLYLAVTTLSFALAVQVFLLSPAYFPWLLPVGLSEIQRPLLYGRYNLNGPRAFYFFCLVILVLALASARALRRSRAGRVMVAARDNERGAQSFGVSVRVARLSAFAISGFWASVAGALFAYQEQGRHDDASTSTQPPAPHHRGDRRAHLPPWGDVRCGLDRGAPLRGVQRQHSGPGQRSRCASHPHDHPRWVGPDHVHAPRRHRAAGSPTGGALVVPSLVADIRDPDFDERTVDTTDTDALTRAAEAAEAAAVR